MDQVNISAPWITFSKEIYKLFERDQEITVLNNDTEKTITMFVSNYEKAQALRTLLPESRKFGNVNVDIKVIYKEIVNTPEVLFKTAFKDNPAFKYTYTYQTETNPITYVVFDKEVVQYWNDNLNDPHGVTSTLYETIANNVFENNSVLFSTDSDLTPSIKKKYFETHATPEEIKEWDYYNGAGSYNSNKRIKGTLTETDVINNLKNLAENEKSKC